MNTRNKKHIAREFLFLLGSLIIFFIAIAIWSWRYKAHLVKYSESKIELDEMTAAMYEIEYIYEYVDKDAFTTIEEFKEYVDANGIEEAYDFIDKTAFPSVEELTATLKKDGDFSYRVKVYHVLNRDFPELRKKTK